MGVLSRLIFSLLTYFLFFSTHTTAEPVQYCKFGTVSSPNKEIDFCMGVIMHKNESTASHDMYISMTHTRRSGSALGWTAIGPGRVMKGTLMFIIYGDPLSQEAPIISIRGAMGHSQPLLLEDPNNIGGADIRVIQSAWMPSPESTSSEDEKPASIAKVSIVCYSCHLWPGEQKISAEATAQPWMWAWNDQQKFDVYDFNAHLDMHIHHAGAGGWGNFYVDMSRSINTAPFPPSLPPIRPNIAALGASDLPTTITAAFSSVATNPGWHLHGIVMSFAFLLFFPSGVFAMRSGSSKAFKYHWIIQLVASSFLILGAILGLLLDSKISTVHQGMGIAIALSVGAQGMLGWRHHVVFLRIRRRTWLSHSHIWLGRGTMLAGWSNLVSGMLLRGYPFVYIFLMAVVGVGEMLALTFWVWWAARTSSAAGGKKGQSSSFFHTLRSLRAKTSAAAKKEEEAHNYFTLEEDDEDEDEDEDQLDEEKDLADGNRRRGDEESKESMLKHHHHDHSDAGGPATPPLLDAGGRARWASTSVRLP